MADPKDKSGAGETPKGPAPVAPSIPRLTPAVPEKVDPAQSARTPVAGTGPGPTPGAHTPPQISPIPKMAPLVSPGAAAAPPTRTPTSSTPAVPPPRLSSVGIPAIPAIPKVAPLSTGTPIPQVAPLLPPAGAKPQGARPPPLPATQAEEMAELERRFAVLDQLDYFEVMGLDPTASPSDIKRAFHHQSRTYHPDRYFQSTDMELRGRVHAVYKRVTEAYSVLRDDLRRRKYQADITGPDRQQKLRFDENAEAEAKAAVKKEVAEQIGTHPKGRQFFQQGVQDLEAGRLAAAERNIKLALTYEPTNPLYLQKLEEARAKSYEEYKRLGKGFRIE
jgi:DnaJ domain